jgi:hypothetical protein
VGNAANNGFDPKAFLVKVEAGKTILKFERSQQHVFKQGDVADAAFYIQKGSVKLASYLSKGSSRRDFGTGPILRGGVPEWRSVEYRVYHCGRRMRDHLNNQRGDDRYPSQRTKNCPSFS